MKFTSTIFPAVAVLISSATALGINCRGSSNCGFIPDGSLTDLDSMIRYGGKDMNEHFDNGVHIACSDLHFCAFYQNTANGGTRGQALDLIDALIDHGCTKCGSAPTEPGNDVSTGELTVNYVS